MDKNTVIGIILIVLIFIGFGWYSQPTAEQIAQHKHQQDSIADAQKTKAMLQSNIANAVKSGGNKEAFPTLSTDSMNAQQKDALGVFAAAAQGKQEFIIIENELMKVKLSSKGGRVYSVELKQYKTSEGRPVELFDGDSTQLALGFFAQNRNIYTNNLFFKPEGTSFKVSGIAQNSVSMRLYAGPDEYIEYRYTLKGNSYDLGFKINFVGMQNTIAINTNYMAMDWKMTIPLQEKEIKTERGKTTVYFKYLDDDVDYISERKDERKDLTTKVQWIGFKQQYFTSVLIADKSFDKPTTIESISGVEGADTFVKKLSANFTIPYSHQSSESFGMKFYFGPLHYKTLKAYDISLEKQIPLGWGIFGWVNKWLVIPVFDFLCRFNMNFGLLILLMTLIFRLILIPFTYKAYISQASMKVLKPEIDVITAKKYDDPIKTQQETMALYKKAGINPMGGCLPMLFQLPIIYALFSFFPSAIELRQQSFLWAHDLSTYDSILDLSFSIPFYGNHVSLFTILMSASTIVFTIVNGQAAASPQMAQMKWMMYLMPVIFLGVLNNYAAGLSLYYFTSNILSIGQQFLFRRVVDEDALHKKIQEKKKRPQADKKSKFQQRLEDMAKQRGIQPPKR